MLKGLIAGMALLSILSVSAEACTVMVVTKGASVDGSVLVSHSNDGFGGEMNLVYVPAKDHPKGSLRPVYPTAVALDEMPDYNAFNQPALVTTERGDGWNYPGRPQTKPIGYIPQVEHTYAYMDADYGVLNEHGLMFGECTDKSEHLIRAPYKEGEGIFYASELSHVALERCKTAREAIQLMGSLIDEYGLWGTAETLAVGDKNEAWIFEMQMVPGGKGGLWIAEKIPDGNYSITGNQLRIRAIREGDSDQMFNPRLPQMLKDLGWAAYDENGKLDWVLSLEAKEFNHPYYSQRRVWRGLSSVAPSKHFPPRVANWDSKTYPLSVTPDKKLDVEDIMRLHRDYYQGTEFDKSKSSLAGLYGSPYHYEKEKGERSILSAKTSYSHVVQNNDALPSPIVWYAMNTPLENSYIPFAVAEMPRAYKHALRDTYDPTKMYWTANQVMSLSQGYFDIIYPLVKEAVGKSEENSLRLIKSSRGISKEKFAEELNKNAVKIFEDWKQLYSKLLMKYNCGVGIRYEKLPDPHTPEKY